MSGNRLFRPLEVVAIVGLAAGLGEWRRQRVPLPEGRPLGSSSHRRYGLREVAWIALLKACADAGLTLHESGRFGEAFADSLASAILASESWDPESFAENCPLLVITHSPDPDEEAAGFIAFASTIGGDLLRVHRESLAGPWTAQIVNLGELGRSLAIRVRAFDELAPDGGLPETIDLARYCAPDPRPDRDDGGRDPDEPQPSPTPAPTREPVE